MQHLCWFRPRGCDSAFTELIPACQTRVRFFASHRIEAHAPPLVRVPVNYFEFQPCDRTPQAEHLMRLFRLGEGQTSPNVVLIVYGQDYRGI